MQLLLISPDTKECVQDQDAWLNIDLNSLKEKQEIQKEPSNFGIHYLFYFILLLYIYSKCTVFFFFFFFFFWDKVIAVSLILLGVNVTPLKPSVSEQFLIKLYQINHEKVLAEKSVGNKKDKGH